MIPFPRKPRHRAGLGFVAVTIALEVMSHSIVFPVLPRLVAELTGGAAGAAARWVGVLVAAWSLAQLFAAPVIGMLSDRFGRRPVILLSLAGLGGDLILMALAPSLGWLLAARLLSGLTAGGQAAAMAYVADITAPEDRARNYGWLNAAAWSGVILGPALGGVLSGMDLRAPFWAAAALTLANALYGWLLLPESLPRERRAPLRWRTANPLGALGLLSRPGLPALAAAAALMWLAVHVLNSVFVLYTGARYGWTPTTFGLFASVMAALNIAIQTKVAGVLPGRWGERRTVLFGLAMQVAGYSGAGLAPDSRSFWAANLLIPVANVAGPALGAIMTRRVGADEQGRLQGAVAAIASLAGLGGPLFATQLFAWSQARLAPALWGLPLLAGAALSLGALGLTLAAPREVPEAPDAP